MSVILSGYISYNNMMKLGYASPFLLANMNELVGAPDAYQNVFTYPSNAVISTSNVYCVIFQTPYGNSIYLLSENFFTVDRYNRGVFNNRIDSSLVTTYGGKNIYYTTIGVATAASYPTKINIFDNTLESPSIRDFGDYIFDGSYSVTIDPYTPIAPTTSSGGFGTFDFITSDDVDFPLLPSLSAVSTGFVSLWSPNVDQMLRLSSFMWNADILTTDFWKKLIANPMELIYGLSLVPLNLSSLGYIDGEGTVVVGLINTGITMNHLSSQWVLFDCGTITLDETWGAYLDYDPYTKLEIYLPFCGVHPLKVDDFMPGTISLKYYIDLLSGTCVAVVKSTKSNQHGDVLDSVVYQFMGNCAAQIPVTAQQFADAVRAAINIAASIGSMVATGVGGAAAAAGAKNALGGISTTARTVSQEISTGASAVENVMNIKPAIERSGAIGSAGSLLSVRTPYLIFTRPRMARPDSQNVYTGYPSFITETLGDLKGWTIVQAIHLDNIPCTSDEMNEIDELLKGGVIF